MTRLARGTLDPKLPPSTEMQEAWLWVQHLAAHQERLAKRITSFPALHDLSVTSYYDPKSTAALMKIQFRGGLRERVALRTWAADAGLALTDTGTWSDEKKACLDGDTARFRCRGTESTGAARVRALAVQLTRASMQALRGPVSANDPSDATGIRPRIATWTAPESKRASSEFDELTL